MSDVAPGPGYWKASDGSWYPPDQHPDPAYRQNWTPAPPAGSAPAAGSPTPIAAAAQPAATPTGGGLGSRIDLRWLIAGGIGVVAIVLLVMFGPFGGPSTPSDVPHGDWVAALDELCESSQDERDDAESAISDALSTKDGPNMAEGLSRLLDSTEDLLSSARAEGLPAGRQDEATEWFEAQQANVATLRDLAGAMARVAPTDLDDNSDFDDTFSEFLDKFDQGRLDELTDGVGLGSCW